MLPRDQDINFSLNSDRYPSQHWLFKADIFQVQDASKRILNWLGARRFLWGYFCGKGEKLRVFIGKSLSGGLHRNDDRIQQLGVGTVMGLPGDTNLELLHYIGCTDMHWGKT